MIGTRLGTYEIVEEIGKGGMATVYRAYQPSVGRFVALKVIHSHITTDPQALERFKREARLIANLEHPHLVPVYDFNDEHHPPYIVMRYVEGGTLKDVLDTGSLPLVDTSYLLRQIASALDYAHRQGIIHRDIKPSNIMIDRDGNAFLMDFGIARLAITADGITQSGYSAGTPGYMAPEQSMGDHDIDTRADIYAFGVTVYQMVTGVLPYQGETPMKVMWKHLNDPIPSIRVFKPDLPSELDQAIAKAMAKKPEERWSKAAEFASEIAKAAVKSNPQSLSPDFLLTASQFRVAQIEQRRSAHQADIEKTMAQFETSRGLTPITGTPSSNLKTQAPKRKRLIVPITGLIVFMLLLGVVFFVLNRPREDSPPTVTNAPTQASAAAPTTVERDLASLLAAPVRQNSAWTVIARSFDGVEMVLVPIGCFMMGSTQAEVAEGAASAIETPQHQQCIETPFWLDRYEVSNEQFNRLNGTAAEPSSFTDETLPRSNISWLESNDFCHRRGGRLPTEREWEYAARGPDNLIYPWGNTLMTDRVVFNPNAITQPIPVQSYPSGASWVGAVQQSGNILEWTSTIYDNFSLSSLFSYPYSAIDGRENIETINLFRVLRGGDWMTTTELNLRAAARFRDGDRARNSTYGIRCARDFQPADLE